MMKFFLYIILITFSSAFGQEKGTPQRIVLNLTEKPAESISVTWRTVDMHLNSEVRVAEATADTSFVDNVKSFPVKIEEVLLNTGDIVYHYSSTLTDLNPQTLYTYKVGHDSVWSEWSQFKTASDKPSPFQFIYFGDPQNYIKSFVSRIFRAAYSLAPQAAFWLIAGDLITDPSRDELWDEFFYAAGFITRMTPLMPAAGNHEYRGLYYYPVEDNKRKILTPLWRPHFTLPANGADGLPETNYYFDYQNVRFIVLNGTEDLNAQLSWLEERLANNNCKWTIVSIHQPLYSTGKNRDSKEYQEKLLPLYDNYEVDLVLQGHDHVYGRTYKLNNGQIVGNNEKGTVYVVSVSGPKFYSLNDKYKNFMVKTGSGLQLFQVISVDVNLLDYKSYTATGELFDSFELIKE